MILLLQNTTRCPHFNNTTVALIKMSFKKVFAKTFLSSCSSVAEPWLCNLLTGVQIWVRPKETTQTWTEVHELPARHSTTELRENGISGWNLHINYLSLVLPGLQYYKCTSLDVSQVKKNNLLNNEIFVGVILLVVSSLVQDSDLSPRRLTMKR